MRAFTKHTPGKLATNKNFILLFAFLILFNFLFNNVKCENNALANDATYSAFTNELIKTSLQDCQNKVVWLEGIELLSAPLICSFYKKNNFAPVWTVGNELTEQSIAVLDLLKDSYQYGFEPVNFDIAALERFSHLLSKEKKVKKSAKTRVRFEFLMTNSVFAFMSHLTRGTEFSNTKDVFIHEDPFLVGFPGYLNSIISSDNIKEGILKLQPSDSEYIALQSEMEKIVKDMVTSDNTVVVPDIKDDSESYSKLFSYIFTRKGIIKEETNLSDPEVFTSLLIAFQNSMGLRASGKIDGPTRRAVSSFIRTRYADIAKTLEQIRKQSKFDENSIASQS